VAILAAGGKIEANSIAYRNLRHTAEFELTTFYSIARNDYGNYDQADAGKMETFEEFLAERFPGFENILHVKMSIATITLQAGSQRAYISKNIIIDHGIRSGDLFSR